MSGDRLTGSDKRALLLWIVFGIVGAFFAQKYFFRAFPEASVDFRVSRSEALTRAQSFVRGLGEDASSYQSTIVFDVDDNAKTYLERELGLQQANRMMSSELSIWYWNVRFFRPQQEEEFHVRVSPAGEIVGYDHKIEEARAGATLDRAAAQASARQFLLRKLATDLDGWDFLPEEVNSTKRPSRMDWSFTWEKHAYRAKDAPYRLRVNLDGDHIAGAEEYLQVPEAWQRSYQQLRATNIFYNQVALLPYAVLLGAALWLGVLLTRQGQAKWGGAIKLGVIVAILFFLMEMNQWQFTRASYDTHASYASFVAMRLAVALGAALGTALMVSLVLPGAEPLYRASQPDRLRLFEAFSPRGLRSKEFFCSAVVGLSLAATHIGFIVAFYMLGSRFGVWAPQDLNYSDAVNTSFPWIAGVAIGLMASTSEEFLFRLFAIPFLQKVTGSRILAVILPAFSWSFLHSAYPQEPGYIRGIEVGIIGIVAGIVMLRWGILATLIWHYTVDASLVGLLLVRSNSLYFKISGVVVGAAALAPLVFAGVSYLTRGRFETDEDLLNRAQPAPEISLAHVPVVAEATATSRRYDALATGTIGFLVFCLLAGGVLAWRLKPQSIGDYLKLSVGPRSATARADAILRSRGIDPNQYHHAALLLDTTNPVTNEFLRQSLPIAKVNEIYADRVPGALWRVRYFRDSEPEEFAVTLKPDASLHAVWHTLAEAAPGASLTKDEAVALAEKFLREEKKLDLSQWTLVEANSDKRPKRIDHTLTWEQTATLDPEPSGSADSANHAHARIELHVLGNEVSNYRTYIKIPEDWRRKQESQTLPRTLYVVGRLLLFGALALSALVMYLMRLRAQPPIEIPWRRLLGWGTTGLVAFLVSFAWGKGIPNLLAGYPTATPFKLYMGGIAVGVVIFAGLVMGGVVLLYGLGWHYATRAFGEERIPVWTGMPAAYYRDALWIALGGIAALVGLNRLLQVVGGLWPTVRQAMPADFGQEFDTLLPAVATTAAAILSGLFMTGLVALVSSFIGAELRARWLRLLLFFLSAGALVGSGWGSPGDFAKQFLAQAILLSVIVLGVRRIMRFNILGCFLVVAGTSLLGAGIELAGQTDNFYRANGYAVFLALALLLAWPLLTWRRKTAVGTA